MKEEVEKILQKLPPAPKGVEKWIRKYAIENTYMIYNNKEGKAICTRCEKEFQIKRIGEVKHNVQCVCPGCGSLAIGKSEGMGRKKLQEEFRILLFTHRGKTVYGTLFEIVADFTDKKVKLCKWLSALYVFPDKEQKYYKHHPGDCWNNERWESPKKIILPSPPMGLNYGKWQRFERTELYTENLERVFKNSCLKYHWAPDFFRKYNFGAREMVRYIDQSLKYQSLEMLRKAGFEKIVAERIEESAKTAIHIRGKELSKILRVPKMYHKKLRTWDVNNDELEIFQELTEREKNQITYKQLKKLRMAFWDIREIGSAIEILNYTEKQNEVMWKYRDYIRMAERLGWDINRKKVAFPENLRQAHDDAVKEINKYKDEIENRESKKAFEKMAKGIPEYTYEGLTIRPAKSKEELNKESLALSHCVRTYADRIRRGESKILFIRKKEEPDIPFYTLELNKKNEVVQCRGDHNCTMTDEVKEFVENWKEVI